MTTSRAPLLRPLRSARSRERSRPTRLPLRLLVSLLAVAVLGGCVRVINQLPPETKPSADEGRQAAAGDAQAEKEEKGPFEPWEEVLKDTRAIEGYLTFHLKRDNTLFLEVPPGRLGEDFGLMIHYSRGLGDLGIQRGLRAIGDTRLMRITRSGDKLYLVHRNPRFRADPGTPLEASMEQNVGHSVVAAFPIESRNDSTGNLLVDATGFFVSDYASTGDLLGFYYAGKPVSLDDDRSRVDGVAGFPDNVELDVLLTFRAGDPPRFGGPGVADFRSVPVGIRYSLFRLPEEPMTPRPADDRVGHFLTAYEDFSRDREPEPYVRMVNRWRLQKKDHTKEISEPIEPIVFYVDRTVPEEYRPWVKAGIEAWNKAFRAAGFENAIVARDAPADSAWNAEDIRYSTVQWTAAHRMGYAIGPSQVDPRTGEILNADILIDYGWVSSWLREYEEMVAPGPAAAAAGRAEATPSGSAARFERARPGAGAGGEVFPAEALLRSLDAHRILREERPELAGHLCLAGPGKAHQLGVQYAALAARGIVGPGESMPDEYLGVAIKDLVMHEVGHTLGLRHNFKASSGIPYERLQDEAYTREHGVSLSVMDYAPVNLAVDPSGQGHHWNPEVGTYDVWVIRYAYSPVYEQGIDGEFRMAGTPVGSLAEQEAALDKIAREASERLHSYGTDEDAGLGVYSVDPLTNPWDLGSDPLRYAVDRERIVSRLLPVLGDRLVAEGEAWYRLRSGFTSLLFERYIALFPATKAVGGLYFARDHRGDPNARPPFRTVSADRQREAVRRIVAGAFAEDAFEIGPELLNRLAPERWADWMTGYFRAPIDYPIHGQVAALQRTLLATLLHPIRLARMIDSELRVTGGASAYAPAELFESLTDAIWSELAAPGRPRAVDSFRRNLQRAHLDRLQYLMLAGLTGDEGPDVPEDARSLARLELEEISARIGRALEAGAELDRMTRAHLRESKARVDRALEAGVTLSP